MKANIQASESDMCEIKCSGGIRQQVRSAWWDSGEGVVPVPCPPTAVLRCCVNCGLRQRPRWQSGRVFQAELLAAPTALRNRRLCKAYRCQQAAVRALPPEGKVERAAVAQLRPRAPPVHGPRTSVKCLPVSCHTVATKIQVRKCCAVLNKKEDVN
ncbi:hypothetical protein K1T71_010835 [Dendrolimus kikuchii]|uniref:Uncharacterized protein n=1 Tax=Dendrolimus kikuchii TaxID=765133 RepID=A0ACC1CQ19_9NEOP|nr:hypothetical protein K1T71_010835 [Dendrolimus kikuchii]